jgi:hypothetical protein
MLPAEPEIVTAPAELTTDTSLPPVTVISPVAVADTFVVVAEVTAMLPEALGVMFTAVRPVYLVVSAV